MSILEDLVAAALRGGIEIYANPATPEGRMWRTRVSPPQVWMNPKDVLHLRIELETGWTYAQKSTLHSLVRAGARLYRKVPTFEYLCGVAARVPGVPA